MLPCTSRRERELEFIDLSEDAFAFGSSLSVLARGTLFMSK